jgi:hypothetical protein
MEIFVSYRYTCRFSGLLFVPIWLGTSMCKPMHNQWFIAPHLHRKPSGSADSSGSLWHSSLLHSNHSVCKIRLSSNLPSVMVMLRFLSCASVFLPFPPPPPLRLFTLNLQLPCRLATAADARSETVNSDLLQTLPKKHIETCTAFFCLEL